jgi:hypothetical protein
LNWQSPPWAGLSAAVRGYLYIHSDVAVRLTGLDETLVEVQVAAYQIMRMVFKCPVNSASFSSRRATSSSMAQAFREAVKAGIDYARGIR